MEASGERKRGKRQAKNRRKREAKESGGNKEGEKFLLRYSR